MLEGVYKGCTPLFIAVAHSNIIGVKCLAKRGANLTDPSLDGNYKGLTPIYLAAKNVDLDTENG